MFIAMLSYKIAEDKPKNTNLLIVRLVHKSISPMAPFG